jgi:hypothetical protein
MDRYSHFVEGQSVGIYTGPRKKHAIWINEVKRKKWGGMRKAACGMIVQPQTFRGKKGQKYLKRFDPATAETCQQCLRCINSRFG